MDAKREIKINQSGQALIEFLLFIPFMMMAYSLMLSLGNSINGSINQQKIARSYYFYKIQNNSMAPQRGDSGNFQLHGMDYIGWMTQIEGCQDQGKPEACCYQLRLPVAKKAGDECAEPYTDQSTQFIRVMTVFGVCPTTYTRDGGGYYSREPRTQAMNSLISSSGCTNQ